MSPASYHCSTPRYVFPPLLCGAKVRLIPHISKPIPSLPTGLPRGRVRGDAFEFYRSHSTHCEGWGTRHPDRGAQCLARVSRRGASPDEDPGIARWEKSPTTPPGCRTIKLARGVRHPDGVVYIRHIAGNPGSSALRASTPGLKADDPSGAPPLRDRQAGALGEESPATDLLCIAVKIKCVTPAYLPYNFGIFGCFPLTDYPNAQMRHPYHP